jgi:hypothetical protein
MACEGNGRDTMTTPATSAKDYETREKATKALLDEIFKQVVADREKNGDTCASHDDCPKGRWCATSLQLGVNPIDQALTVSPDGDGDYTYGYRWPGGTVTSFCQCKEKEKKKDKKKKKPFKKTKKH